MKFLFFLWPLLFAPTVTAQVFSFDQELLYICKNSSESQHNLQESRRYLINKEDPSYIAVLIRNKNRTHALVFKKFKNNKIATLSLDNFQISKDTVLSVPKSFLMRNSYTSVMNLSDYRVRNTRIIDSKMKSTYIHKRKRNAYKIDSIVINTKKIDYEISPEVGFGDYYATLS